MAEQYVREQLVLQGLGSRAVVAGFDGLTITSAAGALLLRVVESAHVIIGRFAACFTHLRDERYVEHSVPSMVAQRIHGLCLGYEDVVDHDQLREDPLIATLCEPTDVEGRRRRRRDRGRPYFPPTSAALVIAKESTHRLLSASRTPTLISYTYCSHRRFRLTDFVRRSG